MAERWRTLIFLFVPMLVLAQNRAGSIQGIVADRVTLKGIEGASVLLTGIVDHEVVNLTTKTSVGGQFVFPNVAPSEYWLIASHGEGHLMTVYQQRGLSLIGKPIPVSPGEQIIDRRIEMVPTGEISGRVVDAKGKPVSGANVSPLARIYRQGVPVLSPVKPYTRTNGRGEYRLTGLPPGPLFLRVTVPRLSHRDLLTDHQSPLLGPPLMELEGYPHTYFRGTMDPHRAEVVYLRAGEHRSEVDIAMSEVSTRRIRGLMVDGRTGTAVAVAQLVLIERSAAPIQHPYRTVEIKNGRFDLRGVRPGSYYLIGASLGGQPHLTGRIVLDVDSENRDGLVLPLMPDMEISGRVLERGSLDEIQKGISGVTVTLRPEAPASAGPEYVPMATRDALSFPPIVATSTNGVLRFRGIHPWQYSVELLHPFEDSYVESIRLGGIDLMTDGLTMGQELLDELEVVLAAPGARVDGQVLDRMERPAVALRVVLIPEDRERRSLYRHTWTDEDGRFQMKNLSPGNYDLFAWEFVENEMWLDRDFLRLYEDKGVAIRLEKGRRALVTLHTIPPWH